MKLDHDREDILTLPRLQINGSNTIGSKVICKNDWTSALGEALAWSRQGLVSAGKLFVIGASSLP